MTDKITLEQFIERYNQESDWNGEILSREFLDSHPFIKDNFIDYLDTDKITPEYYDYSSAELYECNDGKNIECQMYCNETYATRYMWIHQDMDEKAYKENRISILRQGATKLNENISKEIKELSEKETEVKEMLTIINKQN